jgi:amino acid adenylation domain-containing protein
MLGHLETLLTAAVADPATPLSRLPLLSAAELAQLATWNATTRVLGAPITMSGLIATAAARHPGQPAVVSGDTTLSWEELRRGASRLARALQARGVGPDVPVGLCLERSADLVVAMVGILWSGGAYVPLLPDLPPARLGQQLGASGTRLVVTLAGHRSLFPPGTELLELDTEAAALAGYEGTPPDCPATPAHLAYVLFTSGSTGAPKGVAVTHGNLVHYTRAVAWRLGLDLTGGETSWHCGSVSTLAADLGHTSVFPALASAGTLHVLAADLVLDRTRFQDYVARHPLDLLKITPSHFSALAGPEFASEHLPTRWLVLGGEACPWSLVDAVLARNTCRVLNHYGPTETTVGATTFEPAAHDVSRWSPATVPIGAPLPNVVAELLDSRQQPVPIGVPGELWLGGAGVARGYLGRPDLTAERFVTLGEGRRYRTGDRVRRLPTGDLEFLGRLDTQVKLRGHRVELGEIETVLALHPSVRHAVVTPAGETLVGYVVEGSPVTDAELAAHTAAALPDFMVPAQWLRLDRLPLTANGKLDRTALPAPTVAAPAAAAEGGGDPRNEIEAGLARHWADVLKRERVARTENFFALGGHSLLAIRLLGRLAKAYGVRLSLRTLFENPTIETLAPFLTPRHRFEEPLSAIWSEILKRDTVDRDANFFAMGGHSLLAIRLLGKVAKGFGVRLSLRTLFEQPTVALLAPAIEAAGGKTGA